MSLFGRNENKKSYFLITKSFGNFRKFSDASASAEEKDNVNNT